MLCDTFAFLAGFSSFFERKRMSRRVFLTKKNSVIFGEFMSTAGRKTAWEQKNPVP